MQFNEYQFKPEVALERYDGDKDLLNELVRIFIGELPIYLEELCKQTDLIYEKQQIDILPKLQSLSHKIRGSAFAIGLESLGNLAEKIEHELTRNLQATTHLKTLIEQLHQALNQASDHLPTWLSEGEHSP